VIIELYDENIDPLYLDFPTIEEGVRGMEFIDAVVRSGKDETTKWIHLPVVK